MGEENNLDYHQKTMKYTIGELDGGGSLLNVPLFPDERIDKEL